MFVDSSYAFENVCEFFELDALVCSPNVFGQLFDPYISLGLEQYGILSNSCSINDVFVILLYSVLFFCASGSIMCPTSVIVFYISNCQMTGVSNFGDAMFFASKVGEGIELDFHVKDLVPKNQFLDHDEKEIDSVVS